MCVCGFSFFFSSSGDVHKSLQLSKRRFSTVPVINVVKIPGGNWWVGRGQVKLPTDGGPNIASRLMHTPYSHSRICSSSHHASLYLPLYIALWWIAASCLCTLSFLKRRILFQKCSKSGIFFAFPPNMFYLSILVYSFFFFGRFFIFLIDSLLTFVDSHFSPLHIYIVGEEKTGKTKTKNKK